MARYGTQHKGGPQTEAGKARALANLKPHTNPIVGPGRINEEIRNILRQGAHEGAPLQAAIAQGKSPFKDVPDYTPTVYEIQKAFEICAKHSLPELEKVIEERFIYAAAEVYADTEVEIEVDGKIVKGRLTFDSIQVLTESHIAKLTAPS